VLRALLRIGWSVKRAAAGKGEVLVVAVPRAPRLIPCVESAFPGAEVIEEGLRDLAERRESIPSLLVQIGRPRLERLGLEIPPDSSTATTTSESELPEHRLYHLLAATNPDSAHSRYNALIRRLVSFERAAECASR